MANSVEILWLRKAIGEGLAGLIALHLDGGPGAETVKRTAGVWYAVLREWPIVWDEALDRPRLRDAFRALAGQAKRWPAPSELRHLLPKRQYVQPALPATEYPKEKAKRNLAAIRKLQGLADRRADLLRRLSSASDNEKSDLEKAIADIEHQQREVYSQ